MTSLGQKRSAENASGAPDSKKQHMSWDGMDILSIRQFDADRLQFLCDQADRFRAIVKESGKCELLRGKILANVFFEASTRTSCSFQAAMLRLGGDVLPLNESASSSKKGETLSDTIRCLECYADVTVLRHPVKFSAREAAAAATKPVINAGDGANEHPTQALLDFYTIAAEIPQFFKNGAAGRVVAMVGDLKHGRTVHSLARLLALFKCTLRLVSPAALRLPEEVRTDVQDIAKAVGTATAGGAGAAGGASFALTEHENLSDVIGECDIVYVTRIQRERFESTEAYEAVRGSYVIDSRMMSGAKAQMALMHPLPRVGEIAEEVDSDPRAAYFRQMENGLYVRMALLALVLGKA